jgi:hypothetical protein
MGDGAVQRASRTNSTPELLELREKSLEQLGRTQSRAYFYLYGATGSAVMLTALFTLSLLEYSNSTTLTPLVLITISFIVGFLTLIFGYLKSRSVAAAAKHDALIAATDVLLQPARPGVGGLGGRASRRGSSAGRKVSSRHVADPGALIRYPSSTTREDS